MFLRVFFSVISVIAGYSAFVAFFILQNYQASILALITGIYSSILLHIHRLRRRNRLLDNYSPEILMSIAKFGYAGFAVGISTFIYNIIIFAYLHVPLLPVASSSMISAIWCLLMAKSGILLFWYGRIYTEELESTPSRTPLLRDPENSQ